MYKAVLYNGGFYHVYNRGVDQRLIFQNAVDKQTFLGMIDRYAEGIVSVVCFCLMDNHYHLVLQQVTDCGISIFMQKLMNSYTRYFNYVHARTGTIFESSHKRIEIQDDAHFAHISRYVHLNPIDIFTKKSASRNVDALEEFLINYEWSSFRDYLVGIGRWKFLDMKPILSLFENPDDYRRFVMEWILRSDL